MAQRFSPGLREIADALSDPWPQRVLFHVERADHGTRARYTGGCRCDACKVANATYQRERYQSRADVRAARQAQQEAQRRAAGILPRPPATPVDIMTERELSRARVLLATETDAERSERLAARRAAMAALSPAERERRLELQRARNAVYRANTKLLEEAIDG